MIMEVMIINNSFSLDSGRVLGYCSIVPRIGEEHMFGDKTVYFAYEDNNELYFSENKVVNEDDEAEFIQNYLLKCGSGIISTDDIKLVIEAQMSYLKSIGLVE